MADAITRTDFSKLCPIFAGTSLEMGNQHEIVIGTVVTSLSITTQQTPYRFRRPIDVIGAIAWRNKGPATVLTNTESISSVVGIYTDSTAAEGTIIGSISIMASQDWHSNFASGDVLSTRFTSAAKLFTKMRAKSTMVPSLNLMTVCIRYRDA